VYKTTNFCLFPWPACYCGRQDILTAKDPDLGVIDLDPVNQGVEVFPAAPGVGAIQLLPHEFGKCLHPAGGYNELFRGLGIESGQGSQGGVPFVLEDLDALLQLGVQIDDAVFNRAIEAIEF